MEAKKTGSWYEDYLSSDAKKTHSSW
jgi:hypothetical protein